MGVSPAGESGIAVGVAKTVAQQVDRQFFQISRSNQPPFEPHLPHGGGVGLDFSTRVCAVTFVA